MRRPVSSRHPRIEELPEQLAMSSLRQIAANQLNAQKSTGPKTDEGKAISRGNALKHGFAGSGIVAVEGDEQEIAERIEAWRGAFEFHDV
jgi:hypothetical protein